MHIQTNPTFAYTHPITYKHTQSLSFHSQTKKKKTKHTTNPITNLQIILTKI